MSTPHQNGYLQGISLHFGHGCTNQAANRWHEAKTRSIWIPEADIPLATGQGRFTQNALRKWMYHDVSHAVASQNGALWAIYAVEWMISSTAAASSCRCCSLCFWPSQIDSIDIHWPCEGKSFPAQAHVFVCFGPLRRWLRAFSPQGGARLSAHRTDIPINKRLEGLKILKSLLRHVISINQWLIMINHHLSILCATQLLQI